jgi:hypothetical protein
MKSLTLILSFLVIIGCGKKDGPSQAIASLDSTQIADNSVAAATVSETTTEPITDEYVETQNNSDEYADEPRAMDSVEFFSIRITLQRFTEGAEEEMITAGLEGLLKEYSTRKLDPVRRSYNRKFSEQYEDEGGQPYTSEITERKSEVWWYDSAGQLAVYTSVYRQNDGDGYHANTQLYLFDSDSIVAGFEDGSEATQIAFATRIRAFTKKCPYCGVQLMNDLGTSSHQLQPLLKAGIVYIKNELDKSWDQAKRELLQEFARAKLNNNGIYKYTITTREKSPYKAKLEISKALYDKLFAGI